MKGQVELAANRPPLRARTVTLEGIRVSGFTRVGIIDDHTLHAEALGHYLDAHPAFQFVGVLPSLERGRQAIAARALDVVLVHLCRPLAGDLRTVTDVLGAALNQVVVVTPLLTPSVRDLAAEAGVAALLPSTVSPSELVHALQLLRARNGEVHPFLALYHDRSAAAPPSGASLLNGADLTEREYEVLLHLAEGHDVTAIGKTLGISVHTARTHVKRVMRKLDSRTQLEAVLKALRAGLIGGVR